MEPRLDYYKFLPDGFNKFVEIGELIKNGTLEPRLHHLIKIRASQINECTFCIDMHVKEAIIDGETHLRLHHVAGWKESQLFSERERAAFLWTEALARPSAESTRDEVFAHLKEHFSDQEIVELTMAITIINVWNRISLGFRSVHGALDEAYGLDKAGL